ncbi:endonuclease/exonuclease/phosphatase family protein [Actinomadura rupiterrae]|uniref:endonuclease/exonuclease/phosphatase family protein n=1 Tax=Actinomadura rupiterrae TaxID=559627 RepID=UPI0020A61830|nr:endonuclease/exonuclease/phosphatase family protein [Actinomadura rupiterrae]MCP2338468.1 endonuclease/exonuclease/phosphatase family metal-dependent hydrolase [Actinomadura rupiterrae]
MAVTVRVVSYNIRSLRDDPDAVARVVRALRPDVLCLQEVPRFATWWWQRRRLARACGMRIAAGRRACGLAVFTAPHVQRVAREFALLSRVPDLHRRALALAVLQVDGAPLIAASTHLDLEDEPRLRHVGEVLARLERAKARHRAPLVLTGDINEEPHGPAWRRLATRFQDAHAIAPDGDSFTFSAMEPVRRIDGVFADKGIHVQGCGVPTTPELLADYPKATDHRPVLATLRL